MNYVEKLEELRKVLQRIPETQLSMFPFNKSFDTGPKSLIIHFATSSEGYDLGLSLLCAVPGDLTSLQVTYSMTNRDYYGWEAVMKCFDFDMPLVKALFDYSCGPFDGGFEAFHRRTLKERYLYRIEGVLCHLARKDVTPQGFTVKSKPKESKKLEKESV